jgi:predicted ArsR family transcriptional regulator
VAVDLSQISILTRREIEARIAGPLIRAFIDELGRDKALAVVNRVVKSLAQESGAQLAKQMGGNSIADFAKGLSAWAAGDAYEIEVLELSDTRYFFDIKRCRYADMYKELGMADLGVVLSCGRDFELVKSFNPRMKLVRIKTIMEGHDHCDFRIALE